MATLIAEDLILLLLDDAKGTMAAAQSGTPVLGGALLVELALEGRAEVTEKTSIWSSAKVHPVGEPPADPVLARAHGTLAEKPRSAQELVTRLTKHLKDELLERLADRGLVERRQDKLLGLFPRTTWPAADATHETELRRRLQDVLVTGVEPDPRTAGLISLLHAIDYAHKVVDRGATPNRQIKSRAKEISDGAWAAEAVREAVQAAIAGAVAATTAATVAATSSS